MTFEVCNLSVVDGRTVVTREKYRSKCDYFQVKLGGIWTYRAPCSWECNDGVRTIHRCAPALDEFENACGPSQTYLYGAPGGTVLVSDAIRAASKAVLVTL